MQDLVTGANDCERFDSLWLSQGSIPNFAQLELLNNGRERSLAVRVSNIGLRHGEPLDQTLEDYDIGKVIEACSARDLKFVLTKEESGYQWGRIHHANFDHSKLEKIRDCNLFIEGVGGEGGLATKPSAPSFCARSIGVGIYSVDMSPYFGSYDDVQHYIIEQHAHGFRGWVFIEGVIPEDSSTNTSRNLAEIKAYDEQLLFKFDSKSMSALILSDKKHSNG